MSIPFSSDLFAILVCPEARTPLKFFDNQLVSTDEATRRAYPIEDGIPIMLIDKSEVLSIERWQQAMAEGQSATA